MTKTNQMTEKTRSNRFAGAYRNGVMVAMYGLAVMFAMPARGQSIERVNVGAGGVQTDKSSKRPMVSGDGAFVVFSSNATNLIPGDTNLSKDIFLVERATGTVARVSVGPGGVESNGDSGRPTISADGRYIAYRSDATNLIAIDNNATRDIFLYDRVAGTTTLVSGVELGFRGNGSSNRPAISGNGRFIAYRTKASNLVSGEVDTNGNMDILVFDRVSGTTTRVSVDSSGAQATGGDSDRPAISSDGRYVVFSSKATNLVAGDSNGVEDIFLHDRDTGETTRVSVASDGTAANNESSRPAISGDGRFITFTSSASNLVSGDTNGVDDVFLHDRDTGVTTRISVAADGTESDGPSSVSTLSADGSFISFRSVATNLVVGGANGVEQVYIVNRVTGSLFLVSAKADGSPGSNPAPVCVPPASCNPKESSSRPSLSTDGQLVVFHSIAVDLVPDDTNDKKDIFLRDVSGLDLDGDGFFEADYNCPSAANADQADADGNGIGDVCDDRDGDGVMDSVDGCPDDSAKSDPGVCGCGVVEVADCGQDPGQQDTCPNDPDKLSPGVCGCGVPDTDTDSDGVMDCLDNCINDANADQIDTDGNGDGDACDLDDDSDGIPDTEDNCPQIANHDQADADGDGIGTKCDPTEVASPDGGVTTGGDNGTGGSGTDGSGTDSPGGGADAPTDVQPGADVPTTDPGTDGSSTTPPRSICGSFGMITFPMMFAGLCLIGRTPRRRKPDQS